MDIAVTGRHVQISDKFREHLDERLTKVEQLAPRVQRIDVVVSHEDKLKDSEWVEVTCRGKGLVVRSEAAHEDRMAALDLAMDKLIERVKKANEKRKVRRRDKGPEPLPVSPDELLPSVGETPTDAERGPEDAGASSVQERFADSPIEVRVKVHRSTPMTLEDALNHMELIGHDFFLFHDMETGSPSVVYRRRGWSYGVLHLDLTPLE